jgi:hypothetical protein
VVLGWCWFVIVQLISLVAYLAGLVVLLPFCLAHAWTVDQHSIKDGQRPIDRWSFAPLNYVYGNPEDGVSGEHALIWDSAGHLVPYMPGAPAWWRAYCWSALRNSAGGLKHVFAWEGGPYVTGKKQGGHGMVYWNQENLRLLAIKENVEQAAMRIGVPELLPHTPCPF